MHWEPNLAGLPSISHAKGTWSPRKWPNTYVISHDYWRKAWNSLELKYDTTPARMFLKKEINSFSIEQVPRVSWSSPSNWHQEVHEGSCQSLAQCWAYLHIFSLGYSALSLSLVKAKSLWPDWDSSILLTQNGISCVANNCSLKVEAPLSFVEAMQLCIMIHLSSIATSNSKQSADDSPTC